MFTLCQALFHLLCIYLLLYPHINSIEKILLLLWLNKRENWDKEVKWLAQGHTRNYCWNMYAIFTQYTKTAIKNHVFGKNFEKKKTERC